MTQIRFSTGLGLASLLALATLLAGCGASTSASSLGDTEWELEELHGRDVLDDISVSMHLGADDKLSGSGGCNRYFGTWETGDGQEITLQTTGATMMACDQAVMDQEQVFMDALTATASFHLGENVLRLYDAEGKRVAEFERIRPAQLTNTQWEAMAINNGQQGVVSVLEGTRVTALFESLEYRLSGNAGCNTYATTFSRDDGSLTIDPLATTMMACEQPIMDQESWFFQALEQVATYELGRESLYLRAEDGALLIMFREAD